MCGRFALFASENEIVDHFRLKIGLHMQPRFNIAPSQTIPVIWEYGKAIEFCRWGFIPYFVKPQDGALPKSLMNARQETLAEKPAFRYAFKNQRCLIPASGFFEWQTIAGKKQPFFIQIKDHPLFAFAGIYSIWQSQGMATTTCAIITTQAPHSIKKLHDRMPVILEPKDYEAWLEKRSTPLDLTRCLAGSVQEKLTFYPVTSRMNTPDFEGKECVQPL